MKRARPASRAAEPGQAAEPAQATRQAEPTQHADAVADGEQAPLMPAPAQVTPAQVTPARVTAPVRRVARPAPDGQWQLSIFGVEARPPVAGDLEGLLAGAGQVTRMGGTARVSIVVDEAWRAAALMAECALRGLAATREPATVEGHIGFRTAYSTALAPLGARWLRGAVKAPPPGFVLDGRRLRLWVAAAGAPDGAGAYLLRLGPATPGGAAAGTRLAPDEDPVWLAAGAALMAVGLPAVLLGPRAGGPAYRIVGRRRIARLFELVGEAPRQAPAGTWPSGTN